MKKLFLLPFCLAITLPALTLPATALALPLKTWKGFENGTLTGWKLSRLPRVTSAIVISGPTRAGRYAASITLRAGETYGDSWKSELTDPLFAPYDTEIWYRVSHYLPSTFAPAPNNECVLAQWHNTNAEGVLGGSPPIAHRYQNGRLSVTLSYSFGEFHQPGDATTDRLYSITFARGKWHDFVYRVRWSLRGEGEVDAWYNGKFMGSYRGPLGYTNDVAGPYFKTGVYCERTPSKKLTAYVDEYRRGPKASDILLPFERLEGQR